MICSRFFNNVYSYFGTFLGCSALGSPELQQYKGKASMHEVHKFMYINSAEMAYFIDQAVRGLLSFGVSQMDAQYVNDTLHAKFNLRCAPPEAIIPPTPAMEELQAICTAPDCGLSPNAPCGLYEDVGSPEVSNGTLLGNYTKGPDGKTGYINGSSTGGPKPTGSMVQSGATVSPGLDLVPFAAVFGLTVLMALY